MDSTGFYYENGHKIISEIYHLVSHSGTAGLSYEGITRKVDLRGQTKEKMQSYLVSHYCRKLFRLSLLEIRNQRRKGNTIVERSVRSRVFSDAMTDNLLHKRTPEDIEDGQSVEEEEEGEGEEVAWKGGSFGVDFYDTQKTFEENFLDLMLGDALGSQEGLLIKEIRLGQKQRPGLRTPTQVHRPVHRKHAGQGSVGVAALPRRQKLLDKILFERRNTQTVEGA